MTVDAQIHRTMRRAIVLGTLLGILIHWMTR